MAAFATAEEIAVAVNRLRKTFATQKTKPVAWRKAQLNALRRLFTENEDALKAATGKDLGRGEFESYALELMPAVMEVDFCLSNMDEWMKPVYTPVPGMMAPATSSYIYEPYGLCLIISAFNYPIQLLGGPLIGAIMAGNCAVLKPSEMAAETEKLMLDLIPKYLDNDAFAVICGGISTTSALLAQKWDKIFFTGSTRVGKIVMKAAAENLTPVSLELGGKSPTFVDDSITDYDLVAQRICWGKYSNAGQTCVAPDYLLVHERAYDRLLSAMTRCLDRFYGPDPQKSPDFSRLISRAHCERLQGMLNDNPGRIYRGGKVVLDEKYIEPTLVVDVREDSKIMKEEIFGPLLPILRVKSMDEAIAFVQGDIKEKPLSLYIFSKNKKTINKIISTIPSGGVLVNDTLFHFANSYVPFGGVGQSGIGGYHGKFSFECFSHRRTVMDRDDHMILDVPFRYPPYTPFGLRVFKSASKLPSIPALTWKSAWSAFSTATVAGVIAVAAWLAYNEYK